MLSNGLKSPHEMIWKFPVLRLYKDHVFYFSEILVRVLSKRAARLQRESSGDRRGAPAPNLFQPPPPPLIWGSGSTTGTCLILRFVENENTRQQLSFSFAELWYSSLEFNSKEKYPHLTNETRWNKRDKVWGSANSFLKVDFHCLVIFTCVHTWILRA